MQQVGRPGPGEATDPAAGERYLLLADISGYTGFMAKVEIEHGVDFQHGIPEAYGVLGGLLDAVIRGLDPDLDLVKLEGDAVFAAAPAARLDGGGARLLATIRTTYGAFLDARTAAIPSTDHWCTACPNVTGLDLKFVLHRGQSVRQSVGATSDLLGPAVTAAHRLLKNSVRSAIGVRPYLLITDAAASGLGLGAAGVAHTDSYPDIGVVSSRVIDLATPAHGSAPA